MSKKYFNRQWDDISYIQKRSPWIKIDYRSNYIIHLSNGTIKYDFTRFDSWADAVEAEYNDFGAEAGQDAMSCCISTHRDAVDEWNRWITLGIIKTEDIWAK